MPAGGSNNNEATGGDPIEKQDGVASRWRGFVIRAKTEEKDKGEQFVKRWSWHRYIK